tara:strand:+ start:212 stop:688 length:477 start_codon:yes stop_codon:yes gene_type:complete
LNGFNHFDSDGQAHMVNVGQKDYTIREATARGSIFMKKETLQQITSKAAKKGDVLGVSRIAAIQATKQTSNIIPLCHPIGLTSVSVKFEIIENISCIDCVVTTETRGQTGVEMEALSGVSVGLLTIYDMCKAVDRGMEIKNIRLIEKKGGKSGHWQAP